MRVSLPQYPHGLSLSKVAQCPTLLPFDFLATPDGSLENPKTTVHGTETRWAWHRGPGYFDAFDEPTSQRQRRACVLQ
jgi:hypothetical protein